MATKKGRKRALEVEGDAGENMAGHAPAGGEKVARKGSDRGEGEEEEMVEGLARAVQAPPPGKRVNKSRAASSGPLVNPARYSLSLSQANYNDTLLFLTRQVQTRLNS